MSLGGENKEKSVDGEGVTMEGGECRVDIEGNDGRKHVAENTCEVIPHSVFLSLTGLGGESDVEVGGVARKSTE